MAVRVGLAGFGLAGSAFHAPVLAAAGLDLAAVVTSRREEVAAAWPGADVRSDFAALIDDPTIPLVVIATPNDRHFSQAEAALAAGKHVAVDKPVALTAAEAERLTRRAKEAGLCFAAFHNRRWDGDFLTLKAILDQDLVGPPLLFESRFDRFRPRPADRWRESGGPGSGLLYDLGPHLIDQTLVLFGAPQTVWADLGRQRDGAAAVDYFHLVLDYGRLRAILHAGSVAAIPGPRFALHGVRGSFVKHGLDPQEAALRAGGRPGDPGWGEEPPDAHGELAVHRGGLRVAGRVATLAGDYAAFYRAMAEAVAGRGPVPVSGEDAAEGLRILEAAMASAGEGRAVPLAPTG
jgi:scyllo-inositol 2-dehydrogenase (NADP+)